MLLYDGSELLINDGWVGDWKRTGENAQEGNQYFNYSDAKKRNLGTFKKLWLSKIICDQSV